MKTDRFYLECRCDNPRCAVVFEKIYWDEMDRIKYGGPEFPELNIYSRVWHGSLWHRLKAAWRLLWSGISEEKVDGTFVDGHEQQLAEWLLARREKAVEQKISPEQGVEMQTEVRAWKVVHEPEGNVEKLAERDTP